MIRACLQYFLSKTIFVTLIIITALLQPSDASASDDFDKAVRLFEAGDFEESLRLFSTMADDHDGAAARNIGLIYQIDPAREKYRSLAVEWFYHAYQKGDRLAPRFLGYIFLDGELAPRDIDLAASFFEKSTYYGDTFSAYELARINYDKGAIDEAINYYRIAADAGFQEAQFELAVLLFDRNINSPEGVRYLTKAVDSGHIDSILFYGAMILAGLIPSDIRDIGLSYLEVAAENGSTEAANLLGNIYLQGTAADQNITEASNWFHMAHGQGSGLATLQLAAIYHTFGDTKYVIDLITSVEDPEIDNYYLLAARLLHENGYLEVHEDIVRALYLHASSSGVVDAGFWVGNFLLEREGETEDALKAFYVAAAEGHEASMLIVSSACLNNRFEICNKVDPRAELKKLAINGNAEAQLMFGTILSSEDGELEAVDWFERSANQGNADAMFNLGIMHFRRLGELRNTDEALRWFKMAIDHGHDPAREYFNILSASVEQSP